MLKASRRSSTVCCSLIFTAFSALISRPKIQGPSNRRRCKTPNEPATCVDEHHKGNVQAIRFAPDGKTVASAGADGLVRLWVSKSGQVLHTLDATFPPGSPASGVAELTAVSVAAVRAGGGHVLDASHVIFSNGAVTLVLILAESHLAIHTWPEEDRIAIDLFSCGAIDAGRVCAELTTALRVAMRPTLLHALQSLPDFPAMAARLTAEHRGIYDAIRSGDGDLAADRVQAHIDGFYTPVTGRSTTATRSARSLSTR